ncbi:methionine import ATP-binding protein MetN [Collibacillus ludicampi]|uniref:Methionine import ATP-binding protein MetN n=1 Tax=Collibacillus ludicampi TaxID=2771369 RepID=A0AAV4LH73_9BACL|nr:methionine ABC transporter ATP-binding protein [Collibacillus ludicampi]GIM47195.1 methionine import ATP-binding protein MetN [Collibacillus ludicampi]
MIELINLTKEYRSGKQSITALKHINLQIHEGEIFGIIGHSGAGKSTLIRCINLLERPTSGEVVVDGVNLTALSPSELQAKRRSIGMIFQHFNLLSSATVFDNVAFPLRLAKRPKSEIKEKVDRLLQLVGLEAHSHKYPAQLSGGQKQRVGIARALANDPKVLLCDEATSALDPQTTQSILDLLVDINRKLGITIVLITHEMHVIRAICDRVAVIDGGNIVELGKVAEVFLNPRQDVTREFIAQIIESEFDRTILQETQKAHHETNGNRRVVQVSFLGASTYEPILSRVTQTHGVHFNILHGTISRMKDVPYGRLVLELIGSPELLDVTIRDLIANHLEVEVIG